MKGKSPNFVSDRQSGLPQEVVRDENDIVSHEAVASCLGLPWTVYWW